MGSGVVDEEQVSPVDLGELPVHGKLVIVFAEGADDVIGVVADGVLLAQDGDVVVGAVHGGPHEVGRAGVDTDVLLVNVLGVDGPGDKGAVGGQHETAHLRVDRDVIHAGGDQDPLIFLPDAISDHADVIGNLALAVGDADAAGKVDKGEMNAELLLDLHGQGEEAACQLRIIVIGYGVAGQESVEAEMLHPLVAQDPVALKELGLGKAVFGVAGVIHDPVGHLEDPARIIAQGHGLREFPVQDIFQEGDVGDVV